MERRAGLPALLADRLPAALALLFPVFFLPDAIDGYVLPRVALLFAGGALALAFCLFLPRASLRPLLGPLLLPGGAVAAAALAALAVSVSPWASLAGEYLRYESAPVRLGYLLLFGACACLLAAGGEVARRRTVSWFLVASSVIALEAAWEWYAYRYGLAGGLDRPDGNLGNAALLGVLEAMALPLALWRLAGRRWRWAPAAALIALGLLLSDERSAWLAAAGAVLAVAAVRVPRAGRPWLFGAAALLAVVGGALLAGPLGALNSDPYWLRLELWRRVLPMLAARPWLGWGEDTFGLVFGPYGRGLVHNVIFDRAHSQPLDLVAAQGLAGLAAAAWFGLAFLLAMLRGGRWRREESPALLAALLAYGAWSLVNFDWAPATAVFWLLAATAWAAGERGATVRLPLPVKLAGAAAGLAAALAFGVLPLAADLAAFHGAAGTAVGLDPIQAEYWDLYGHSLQGPAGARLSAFQRAADLGDQDPQLYVDLGREYLGRGDRAAAQAAFAEAKKLDPGVAAP